MQTVVWYKIILRYMLLTTLTSLLSNTDLSYINYLHFFCMLKDYNYIIERNITIEYNIIID